MKMIMVGLLAAMLLTGCNLEQGITKKFGGTSNVTLEPGKKLMQVTFYEGNFWFLTRKMKPGEIPECYSFKERSVMGVLEGEVKVCERH